MGGLIIIVIGFGLYMFRKIYNEDKQKLAVQGGITIKYRTLISELASLNDKNQITVKGKHCFIWFNFKGGRNIIRVGHSFGNVYIRWEMDMNLLGEQSKHQLKWKFWENYDQKLMAQKIAMDIEMYNKHVMIEKGMIDVFDELRKGDLNIKGELP
ncbi:MAG: hypothetical protein R2730_05765 [Chitinophagales bacterium]